MEDNDRLIFWLADDRARPARSLLSSHHVRRRGECGADLATTDSMSTPVCRVVCRRYATFPKSTANSRGGVNKLPIADDSGYTITDGDLKFLGITERQVVDMLERRVPLGMDAEDFEQFTRSLAEAAKRDGFLDLDVRIQGSASNLFSDAHKAMAYDRTGVVRDFEAVRVRLPKLIEIDRIEARLEQAWPDPNKRPLRRPFDVYYRVGISPFPSDYDVQISSDSIAAKARSKLDSLGVDSDYEDRHPAYKFIKKSLMFEVADHLMAWAALQTDILRRSVTLAVFPGAGPDRYSADLALSSHFRDTDWILDL